MARKLLLRSGIVENQLTVLLAMRDRWIAEYPAVADIDPVRAAHHAQAIADLGTLISRLARRSPQAAKLGTASLKTPRAVVF